MATLSISNLREQIAWEETYLEGLRARMCRFSENHKKHMTLLKKLKAKVRCLSSDKFKIRMPNYAPELNIEWYGFNTAVYRCVRLNTSEWFLAFDYSRMKIPTTFTFTFNIKLDARISSIIKTYKPDVKCRMRAGKLISSDVATALLLSQVVIRPKSLQLSIKTNPGVRSSHIRYYDRTNLQGLRLCRYV